MFLSAKKLYFILLGFMGVAVVTVLGSAYVAHGYLKDKSSQVASAQLNSLSLEEKKRLLAKAKSDIAKYKELAQIAGSIVPQDKDQAQTVREINNLAVSNGVILGSITFPASSLGSSKTDAQLKPVKDIPGVSVLNITVNSDSKRPTRITDFINFLDALEHNRRTALVTAIALNPDTDSPDRLSFVLTIQEYIKK